MLSVLCQIIFLFFIMLLYVYKSKMIQQLSYFHSMESDLNKLTVQSQKINQILFNAYSPPGTNFCQLDTQIDAVIAEEEYLQNTLAVIETQVNSGTFLPQNINEAQLQAIYLSSTSLPTWFHLVIQQQYSSQRKVLNLEIMNLYRMHELSQKRKLLTQQSQNLNTLLRRAKINSLGLSHVDVLAEATHLRNRINHVRKSFQYFCAQTAKKICDWVEQIADKSRNFNKNVASPPKMSIAINQQFRRSKNHLNSSNRNNLQQTAQYTSKDLIQQSYLQLSKRYERRNLQAEFYGVQNKKQVQRQSQKDDTYYFKKYLPDNFISRQNEITRNYYQKANLINTNRHFHNHKANSPDIHHHTCHLQSNHLARVKSVNSFQAISPRGQKKFDYRKVIKNQYL